MYLLGRRMVWGFFFCPKGVHKALSDFRFTEHSVLLHVVPLPQVLRMGDDTLVSSQK